jgi:ElaB/YqjD/DUF883 family membrane-anchored ribosome-binding protein
MADSSKFAPPKDEYQAFDPSGTMPESSNPTSTIKSRVSEGAQQMADKAKEMASSATDTAKDVASLAAEKSKGMAVSVGDRAKGTASAIAEKAQEASRKAGDLAKNVGKKAEETVASVGGQMKSLAGTIREKAPPIAGSAASAVANTLDSGGSYLQEHNLHGMAEDMTSLIRRYPLQSLLVGIGVGFLIARATRS